MRPGPAGHTVPMSPSQPSWILALQDQLPGLREVRPALADLPVGPMAVPAGTVLFQAHSPCQGFPLVLSGEVKVVQASGDGRLLELYRVVPGELCLVSSSCLWRGQALTADGIATRPTELVLVPPAAFMAWLEQPDFRGAVLGLLAQRMADLTALVDAVAFHKLDQRLAAALLGHGAELSLTHQALADQLGTVREIITRLLRRFEQEGWVQLARERIRITDSAALRRVAAG